MKVYLVRLKQQTYSPDNVFLDYQISLSWYGSSVQCFLHCCYWSSNQWFNVHIEYQRWLNRYFRTELLLSIIIESNCCKYSDILVVFSVVTEFMSVLVKKVGKSELDFCWSEGSGTHDRYPGIPWKQHNVNPSPLSVQTDTFVLSQ